LNNIFLKLANERIDFGAADTNKTKVQQKHRLKPVSLEVSQPGKYDGTARDRNRGEICQKCPAFTGDY
jgi:hypothetical protein